jgi:hypothetical protein
VWDFVLINLARLLIFLVQPILTRVERAQLKQQRQRTLTMTSQPIGDVRPARRVKVDGLIEPVAPGRAAFFLRGSDGSCALVQPAAAAAVWCSQGGADCALAAGDHVAIVGVARAADPRIDREIGAAHPARVVFAGSEAEPLFIVRLTAAACG